MNDAEDAPDATVTLAGNFTALLLLVSVTPVPPDGAAELNVTVHVIDPAPMNELFPHENAFKDGVDCDEATVLLRLIDVDFEVAPCVAINVALCEDVTADTFAVKLAL